MILLAVVSCCQVTKVEPIKLFVPLVTSETCLRRFGTEDETAKVFAVEVKPILRHFPAFKGPFERTTARSKRATGEVIFHFYLETRTFN